jgi:hypothetical protein
VEDEVMTGADDVSPGYLFAMDEAPARLTFGRFGLPEAFIEAVHPGDREDEITKAMMGGKVRQGMGEDALAEFEPSPTASFLKKCEVQITGFEFPVRGENGKVTVLRFSAKDRSNNLATYKKLLQASSEIRDTIEGYLDERAHRDTPKAREYAGTGSSGAADLATLGNA